MMEWQPIETAPKDGTKIKCRRTTSNEWLEERTSEERLTWWGEHPVGPGWIYYAQGQDWCWKPTHWMPLPEPPK